VNDDKNARERLPETGFMNNGLAMRYPRYRWVILGLAWLTQFCGTWSWYLVPSLAYALIPEMGLTQTQYSLILTAPLMASIVLAFLGGGFGDRYGMRLAIGIGAFLSGAAGLTRAFTPSFEGMFLLTCLMGVAVSFTMPNLPKLVGIWFPPRQIGLATGIYTSAQAIGFSIGLLTGPLFGGWRSAFISAGMVTLAVATLWALLSRGAPKGVAIAKTPVVAGVIRGIKSKNIWLLCSVLFTLMGAFVSFSGNLPKALVDIHQVSAEAAGATSSLLTWGAVAGTLLLPVISDRFGLRKPFICSGALVSAICFYLAWQIAPGTGTSILVFIGGLFLGGMVPLAFILPLEFPEIGTEYVGGTAGLVNSMANMGGVLGPLLVFSPLAAAGTAGSYSLSFTVAAILLAGGVLPAMFMMETGAKKWPRG